MPSGFSTNMCFFASAAAKTRSRCRLVSEQITTAADLRVAQISFTSATTLAAGSSWARFSARAASWSQTYFTFTSFVPGLEQLTKPGV